MKAIRTAIVAGIAFSFLSAPAAADCLGLARGISSAYMADTGDGKGATLRAQNRDCGRSKGDKDHRWRVISRAYRNFNKAIDSGNTYQMTGAAGNLHSIRNRSSMYESCFGTMVSNAKLFGNPVDQTIRLISLGQC